MADASASAINALIDANSATLKAQIDTNATALKAQISAMTFYPAPITIRPPVISYASVPTLTQGVAMTAITPSNSGDAATFSGTMPAGLSLNAGNGSISGTPTAVGTTSVSITAINAGGSTTATVPITVTAPVVVPPMPGGKASGTLTYSNQSNLTISGLSFDGAKGSVNLLTLNNCSNIHITLCRFSNTNGFAIYLNGCTNITVDYCFFTLVNMGVYAYKCAGTKVNNNQGLNRWAPVQYQNNFAHWVQFNACTGSGQQVNNNIFEDVQGVAVHPHDAISIYQSSGVSGSPIQINNNWIRGGQTAGGWPSSGDTGVGITAPDVSGNYYEVKNNIVVNCGVNGIIVVATGNNILIDGNIMVCDNTTMVTSYDGFTISGTVSAMTVSNNRVRWRTNTGSYTGYWFGGPSTYPGVTLTNNNWNDTSLTSAILPTTIITYQ
jgi:hypothetical protein